MFSDDGYIFGPSEAVFRAYTRFEAAILQRCGLRIQREKTVIYHRGERPTNTPAGLKRAGVEIGGVFQAGFECVGVAIGSPEYVKYFLEKKVDEIGIGAEKTGSLLEEDLQAQWTILQASTQQKFGYWLALQYPSEVQEAAARLDTILWKAFEKSVGQHIPRVKEGQGVE